MNEHKSVLVKLEEDYIPEIDENLADIVKFLWDLGLGTCLSCEDNNGKVWLHFWEHSYKHLMQNAYIEFKILGCKEDSLYQFLIDNCDTSASYEEFDSQDEDADPVENPDITIGLRFPKELLLEFKRLLFRDLHWMDNFNLDNTPNL